MTRQLLLLLVLAITADPAAAQTEAVTSEGDRVLPRPNSTWAFEMPPYPELVLVRGGTFQMGSRGPLAEADEGPVHAVTLSDFHIGKYEVTVAEYRAFCADTGHPMPESPAWGWQDDHPVVNVNWHDAVIYCEWLSRKTGLPFHLPSEAQWEFAARGGVETRGFTYSGGDELEAVAWYAGNAGPDGPRSVGTRGANEIGLFDMSGNVAEWCRDFYGKTYYSRSPGQDPKGPNLGTHRLVRGGSWKETAERCRVSFRYINTAIIGYGFMGFRVAMDQPARPREQTR